ncbi:hypothetical protein AB0758_48635 [Tolypothrix bouteillei VB521301_2]|uniref:hypothetical protein n=1 Tax=Tolypothrix bouteillei TaxID=1246981 RepID=UPI0038B4CC9E
MTANNGIISQISPYPVIEALDRLEAILQAKGITIFARIDQRLKPRKLDSACFQHSYYYLVTPKLELL